MIIIDGISYDIPIISMVRRCEFLDKYAERVESGELKRELIGVYFNYYLKLGSTTNTSLYAALWAKLTEAEEFHTVVVPDESGNYTFTAYFASISDELRKQATHNYWKNLTVHFIAKSPENTP